MEKYQVISECREPTELENISKYMTEVEYVLNTKGDIWTIHCILRKKSYATNNTRNWEVIWRTKDILSNNDSREIFLYNTQEQYWIERCINLMNNFIKDNFKTELW